MPDLDAPSHARPAALGLPVPIRSTQQGGRELSRRARFPRSPTHHQPSEQLHNQKATQVRQEGCERVPAPSPLASPTLPRLSPQDSGHTEGLRRTETTLPYRQQGRSASRGSPGTQPAVGRGAAPISRRRRRTAELRAGSHGSPRPGPTRPPHWLPVTCGVRLGQSAPPEGACWKVWKLWLLSKGAGGRRRPVPPGTARPSATGPSHSRRSRQGRPVPGCVLCARSRPALARTNHAKPFHGCFTG